MSKRNRGKSSRPAAPSAPSTTKPAAQPAPPAVPSQVSAPQPRKRPVTGWLLAGLALLLLVGGGAAAVANNSAPRATPRPTPRPPTSIGPVSNCRQYPAFAEKLGFSRQSAYDTSDTLGLNTVGVALIDTSTVISGGQPKTYRHPSWDDAGHLGPIVVDWDGNAYTVPTPKVALYNNPIELQNRVMKIDSATGVMTELLRLPSSVKPSQANPYGTLGLTIDCETRSLYVATVYGSDRDREAGRIFRIDLSTSTPRITSEIDGVDAMGLAVFKGVGARRLYFGSVRTPLIRSVILDDKGDFYGGARDEASLAGVFGNGEDKARRIAFTAGEMQIRGIEFNFNLEASREKTENRYAFAYQAATDSWKLTSVSAVEKSAQ